MMTLMCSSRQGRLRPLVLLCGALFLGQAAQEAEAEQPSGAARSIPPGSSLRRIDITCSPPGSPGLTPEDLRRIMDRARPLVIDDPLRDPWHYAPWCSGSFETDGGTSRFILYLGGRGDLTLPSGSRIRFEFEL
jgi:hypothetical protein